MRRVTLPGISPALSSSGPARPEQPNRIIASMLYPEWPWPEEPEKAIAVEEGAACTPSDGGQLFISSAPPVKFGYGASNMTNGTSSSQSSLNHQSSKSDPTKKKKRKRDNGSDVEPARRKMRKPSPALLQSLPQFRKSSETTVSHPSKKVSQPIVPPNGFPTSPQNLPAVEPPMSIPSFLSWGGPADGQDDFNNLVDYYFRMLENPTSVAPVGSSATTTTPVTQSACQRLIKGAFAPDELRPLVDAVFSSTDEGDLVRCLRGDDAQAFIDLMDEALDNLNFSTRIRRKGLKTVYRMCGRNKLLPKSLRIPLCYDRQGFPLYTGGFADVWKGEYCSRDVAVKVIRTPSSTDPQNLQKIIGRFCGEVVMWKSLRHPNVLPLIGVTMTDTHFAMVSEWMADGNIKEFMRTHPGEDRLGLLRDVARGLVYIHSQGMIHGDLKGANILIDKTRRARLADFSLLTIVSDPTNCISSSSHTQGGTARWMSPELIDPQRFGLENSRATKSSDCYALGMVIYETISGHLPFHRDADMTVFVKVLNGKRPPREASFTDSLWAILERCWEPQPDTRPSAEVVLRCLETEVEIEIPLRGLDAESDDDDWSSVSDSSEISPLSGGLNTVVGYLNHDNPQTMK